MAGDVRSSTGKVGPGIDVLSSGRSVVMPESPHPDGGTYEWVKGRGPEDIPVAEAPDWLLALVVDVSRVLSPPPRQSAARGGRYVLAAIENEALAVAHAPEGQRNATLNAAAFSLSRFVTTGEAEAEPIRAALTYAARASGLPGWEIHSTLQSAFKKRGVA